jgi:hypothetical protein
MVPLRGIEPRLRALQARVMPLDQSEIKLVRAARLERAFTASEAAFLPLKDIRTEQNGWRVRIRTSIARFKVSRPAS